MLCTLHVMAFSESCFPKYVFQREVVIYNPFRLVVWSKKLFTVTDVALFVYISCVHLFRNYFWGRFVWRKCVRICACYRFSFRVDGSTDGTFGVEFTVNFSLP